MPHPSPEIEPGQIGLDPSILPQQATFGRAVESEVGPEVGVVYERIDRRDGAGMGHRAEIEDRLPNEAGEWGRIGGVEGALGCQERGGEDNWVNPKYHDIQENFVI
jgi:hypothetical protein